jgi:hypothetical protein
MSTLGWMKAEGVRVRRVCASPCPYWIDEDLDALTAKLGPDFSLVDQRPPCPRCARLNIFVASTGKGTPFRPCQTENRPQPPMPADGWPPWPPDR